MTTQLTYTQRIATLSGEDAPETKGRYEIKIGRSVYVMDAYDAPHAERLARRNWRGAGINAVPTNIPTPEAAARWIGKAVTK